MSKPAQRIRLWLLLVLALSWLAPAPLQAQAIGPSDPAELEAFFDGLLGAQLAATGIPGATVAVVKDGKILLVKGYGYADVEKHIPVDGETTLFRPGSVSKLFTWTAVMQLVEEGKLELGADVNTYLDFEIPKAHDAPITLYDLMAHTPGFEDQGTGLFLRDAAALPPLGDYLKNNLPRRVFAPGEIGAYSNYGTALAGYIVERVSRESFESYVEKHIFAPLGMTHSTFRQPLPAALAGDMAQGYALHAGAYLAGDFEVVGAPPAGALSASAADMAAFMLAHLQNGSYQGERILLEATARQMHQQHYTADLRVSGMAHGFMEQTVNGRRIIYHGGDTFLFHSALYLLLDEAVGIFVSYNSAGKPGGDVRTALLNAFMDRYYPVNTPAAPTPPADFTTRAGRYLGEYHLARNNYSSPEKLVMLFQALQISATPENTLQVAFGGETKQYVEIAPDMFRNVYEPDDRLLFLTDDKGHVTQLLSDGLAPLAFIKAPATATGGFHLLLLLGSLLLCLSALITWPIAFIRRRGKLYGETWPPRAARLCAGLFALLALIFVIGFFNVFGDMDPAYGVPQIFFGPTPALIGLTRLLPVVLLLGLGVIVFTVLAWPGIGNGRKAYWKLFGRLHYSAIAVAAGVLFWLLLYWKILGGSM